MDVYIEIQFLGSETTKPAKGQSSCLTLGTEVTQQSHLKVHEGALLELVITSHDVAQISWKSQINTFPFILNTSWEGCSEQRFLGASNLQ